MDREERWQWAAIAVGALAVVVMIVVAIVVTTAQNSGTEAACAAHGWEVVTAKYGLCVDDDGMVRQP